MIEFKKWDKLTPEQKQQAKDKYKRFVSTNCIICGQDITRSLKRYWEQGNICNTCSIKATNIITLRKKLNHINSLTDQLFKELKIRFGIDKEEFYKKHRKNNLFRHYRR